MITPAAAPLIVRSGIRRPGDAASSIPSINRGSKAIYCGRSLPPSIPTSKWHPSCHCWWRVPMQKHHRVAFGNVNEGCKVSGLARRPSGVWRRAGKGWTEPTDQIINRLEYEKQATHNARWSGVGSGLSLSLFYYFESLWSIGGPRLRRMWPGSLPLLFLWGSLVNRLVSRIVVDGKEANETTEQSMD